MGIVSLKLLSNMQRANELVWKKGKKLTRYIKSGVAARPFVIAPSTDE